MTDLQRSNLPAIISDRSEIVPATEGDAARILDRWHSEPAAITYFDPPYPKGGDLYSTGPLARRDRYAELLLAQTGRVLVSGHAGDWPALDDAGWHRHEHTTYSAIAAAFDRDPVRTESPPEQSHQATSSATAATPLSASAPHTSRQAATRRT